MKRGLFFCIFRRSVRFTVFGECHTFVFFKQSNIASEVLRIQRVQPISSTGMLVEQR